MVYIHQAENLHSPLDWLQQRAYTQISVWPQIISSYKIPFSESFKLKIYGIVQQIQHVLLMAFCAQATGFIRQTQSIVGSWVKDLCKLHQQCLDLISPGQGCTVQLHKGLLVGNAVLDKHVHCTLRLTQAVRAERRFTRGLFHNFYFNFAPLWSTVAQLEVSSIPHLTSTAFNKVQSPTEQTLVLFINGNVKS